MSRPEDVTLHFPAVPSRFESSPRSAAAAAEGARNHVIEMPSSACYEPEASACHEVESSHTSEPAGGRACKRRRRPSASSSTAPALSIASSASASPFAPVAAAPPPTCFEALANRAEAARDEGCGDRGRALSTAFVPLPPAEEGVTEPGKWIGRDVKVRDSSQTA